MEPSGWRLSSEARDRTLDMFTWERLKEGYCGPSVSYRQMRVSHIKILHQVIN